MKITVLGGDIRSIILSRLLSNEGYDVTIYGFDEKHIENISNVTKAEDVYSALKECDFLVGPVPFSRDGKKLNTPLFSQGIYIEDIVDLMKNDSEIAGIYIPKYLAGRLEQKNIKTHELSNNEAMNIMSAIPTAEGAIKFAIDNTKFTIFGSKILILGYGRIGKILANVLKAMNAVVYVEARKESDLAWIKAMGYNPVDLKNLDSVLPEFDIIYNTIPSMILDKSRIDIIRKDCLIIDLSTNPGGVDFEACKDKGVEAHLVLGIPGKVAPHTAAVYIKDALLSIMRG